MAVCQFNDVVALRKVLLYICMLFLLTAGTGNVWGQELDSLKKEALSQKLEEYFEALKYENIEVQKAECDFLIEAAGEQAVRDFIAQTIYDHYIGSKLMGAEAVAIHLTDNWFVPGKVKFSDDSQLFAAKFFAEFNRRSQIGERAPEIAMESLDGRYVSLFQPEENALRFRVLYFYDADCSKCRIETILLRNLLETEDFPIDFLAIYLGDDRKEWESYVNESLSPESKSAAVIHLWNPAMDSDYQRKYGVLQTPRLFLVAPDGTILGRGLDAQALSQMLHGIFDPVELEYGSKESETLFDGIFGREEVPSAEDVSGIADHIASTTLAKGDTVMFRQLTGDLLYYLAGRSGEGFKEGMGSMIDKHILGMPEVWRSQDDSLKVIGFAQSMYDLLSKARPGTFIKDLAVPGELSTWKKTRQVRTSLRKLKGERNIIIFYTEGCDVCKAEKAAADAILAQGNSKDKVISKAARKINVLTVNIDSIMATDPSLADGFFDSFDLSSLPFIIQTDKKGRIQRRYLTLR